ncbi:MAG: hypothetical protein V3S29_07310 [bacterium]
METAPAKQAGTEEEEPLAENRLEMPERFFPDTVGKLAGLLRHAEKGALVAISTEDP